MRCAHTVVMFLTAHRPHYIPARVRIRPCHFLPATRIANHRTTSEVGLFPSFRAAGQTCSHSHTFLLFDQAVSARLSFLDSHIPHRSFLLHSKATAREHSVDPTLSTPHQAIGSEQAYATHQTQIQHCRSGSCGRVEQRRASVLTLC